MELFLLSLGVVNPLLCCFRQSVCQRCQNSPAEPLPGGQSGSALAWLQ